MKRIVNLILVFVMISPLYADFKIMGGFDLAKFNNHPLNSFQSSYKIGFLGGFGFEKKITQDLLLEFNLFFMQKGSKALSNDPPYLKSKYSLNVVSIPVLLRYQFLYDNSPYIVAGIESSYVISHTNKVKGQEAIDMKGLTDKSDFGYIFGGGYQIKLEENLFFFIEARWHLGDRNLSMDVEGLVMNTNTIVIMVGIRS